MDQPVASFLEYRRNKLRAGNQAVPLGYSELREQARKRLEDYSYDFAVGGAGSEDTVRANQAAFQWYRIVPQALQDVSEQQLDTELLGYEMPTPLGLAPIGGQKKFHEDGELATTRAAKELGIPLALSNAANHSIEQVAEVSDSNPLFFQLYWPKDWAVAENFVNRAEAAGYDGIVLTVDAQLPRWRPRILQNTDGRGKSSSYAIFRTDPVVQDRAEGTDRSIEEYMVEDSGIDKDRSLTWDDIDTLREWTTLPIILKGILTLEDAERASEAGVDGIVVSNHGGRQIDGEVAPINQLAAINDTVSDDMTILFDSGIRSGADVFKALAMGADGVQIGRPYIFALAIAGQRGVHETLVNYLAELESIMGHAGCRTIDEIGNQHIVVD